MSIIIDEQNEGVRLDRFLKKNCKDDTLSDIFKAIRTGLVRVNNRKQKENYRLLLGDSIDIRGLNFNENIKISKEVDKNLIVFENDDYIIINKPKGVAVHKGTDTKEGLAEKYNINFANRLDKKTSGLLIACKNQKSLRYFTELIRNNKVVKKYKAVCKNNNNYKVGDIFFVDKAIDEKNSLTEFKVEKIDNNNIIFDIKLHTGRKHQIRKHLQSIGLSIIGDDKYGSYKKEDKLMLHCYYLAFDDKVYEIKKEL